MLKKEHIKIHIKRRNFLKATALGSVAIGLPVTGFFKQDPVTLNRWYERLADALNKLPNSFPE